MSSQKTILSLILVCLAIAGLIVYYLYPKNTSMDNTAYAQVPPILLYVESGDVSYKSPGAELIAATTSPVAILNQTLVRTGVGRASVLLPDNSSIALAENTEITVSYSPLKTSIYQTIGTTYHRVETLITGGSYQVQTPGTLAAVRGTKFAVKYDLATKKTKVAVTERQVQVSTITSASQSGTSTPVKEETIILTEGKSATILTNFRPTKDRPSAIESTDIDADVEIRNWVNEQKAADQITEKIHATFHEKAEIRKELRKELFKDTSEEPVKVKTEINVETVSPEKPVETATNVETTEIRQSTPNTTTGNISKATTTTVIKTTTETQSTVAPIVKMDEEKFFDIFNDMFIKNFYLDDSDTPCSISMTPDEKVRSVTSFATTNGYPFTKTTLLSFAQAVDAYCKAKDSATKVKLQERFDVEFPYNDNI